MRKILKVTIDDKKKLKIGELQEKTQNARDTNVTIDYKRKLRKREILTQQSIIRGNLECARY